jgi:hypothetical protein
MGMLDNSVLTVDAILTKRGRELLAQGSGRFNITHFALSDDGVDYSLFDPAHPLGTNYFGAAIESMPVTEAVPDETQSMKYKLISLPTGQISIPYIETIPDITLSVYAPTDTSENSTDTTTKTITPVLKQWDRATGQVMQFQNYTFTLLDTTYVVMTTTGATAGMSSMSGNSMTISSATSVTLSVNGQPREILAGTDKMTKLIITNSTYGSRIVVPITVTKGTLIS